MAASVKVPAIFTAEDKFSKVVDKMTKGVRSFSRKTTAAVDRFDRKVTNTFNKMGRLSQLALGVGFATIFSAAIQNNIAYEDSLASVSAITGAVGDDLVELEKLSKSTAKEQKMLGADVLKAYELIGSAKPELLENSKALDDVTRSTITLSKASRMDLESSAKSLTDVMNQFNKTGEQSGAVIDVLAAGAKYGAAAIPSISEAVVQFGSVASQANVSLNESVAAIEVFAARGIKGAEAGTKMRNVLTTMSTAKALPKAALEQLERFGVDLDKVSDTSIPFNERLKEMSKISGDATAMVKVFGKENQAAGSILLNNIDMFEDLNAKVGESGVAQNQATKNTNTFKFAIDSIKNSFLNATTATQNNNAVLGFLKDTLFAVSDNMGLVIGTVAVLIGLYGTMKAITWGMKVATAAYNVVLGIQTALQQNNKRALIGNTVAQGAYRVAMIAGSAATWIGTAATTAFGVAMNLSLWPILLVVAAIAGIIAIIMNWSSITDWFGEKWGQFTEWISSAWEKVTSFFSDFDFEAMFRGIGQAIIEYMLFPIKGILLLLSKIPGTVGEMAGSALQSLNEMTDITGNIGVEGGDSQSFPSSDQANSESISKSIRDSQVNIDVRDKGGNVERATQDGNELPVNTSSTVGAF